MGRWDRRYVPRRKYRHYEYDDPPLSPPFSPPRPYSSQSSGFDDNGPVSWEIEYCKSVRVRWHKVLASKKYIYSHPKVQEWDDSAGKEAFDNAKQRYWATINDIPHDNPLPDPDMYVDEIDWDSYIDPELISDLYLQAFDPDESSLNDDEKLETINEAVEREYNSNNSNKNPWEKSTVDGGSLKDGWGDSVNLRNDNPWEQSSGQVVESLKNNPWKNGNNESWGWGWDNNTNAEGSRNTGRCGYGNNYSRDSAERDRGWKNNRKESWGSRDNRNEVWGSRDNRNESWESRKSGYGSNEPTYWDSGSYRRGGKSFRGGWRKRESSVQHTSKYSRQW